MKSPFVAENEPTEETKEVERVFREAGFPNTESYRHNSASIRVRVRDERFRGLSRVARIQKLNSVIEQLAEETQQDLIFVLAIAPGEENGDFLLMNLEFENPRRSTF